jgi:hypothetical protein
VAKREPTSPSRDAAPRRRAQPFVHRQRRIGGYEFSATPFNGRLTDEVIATR